MIKIEKNKCKKLSSSQWPSWWSSNPHSPTITSFSSKNQPEISASPKNAQKPMKEPSDLKPSTPMDSGLISTTEATLKPVPPSNTTKNKSAQTPWPWCKTIGSDYTPALSHSDLMNTLNTEHVSNKALLLLKLKPVFWHLN